jgi:hypothetical protein
VSLIELGVPSLTVTVVVAALTVPIAALIVVWQAPVTLLAGVTKPVELIVAQLVSLEVQSTLPVKSFVEPSLYVPVADIWRFTLGFTVMV